MFRVALILLTALLMPVGNRHSIAADKPDLQTDWGEVLGVRVSETWSETKYRAFDFWIGEWEMVWSDRQEGQLHFDTDGPRLHHRVFPILDGKAIVELAWNVRASQQQPSGRGFSIRYFNEEKNRWVMAQNWPRPGNLGIAFTDQLVGVSDHGREVMYSSVETNNADGTVTNSLRRYNFADIRDGAFRWDGSNSNDQGASWTTWKVVRASRLRGLDPFGSAGTAWPDVQGRNLCTGSRFDRLRSLEGQWNGTLVRPNHEPVEAILSAGAILDGCGVAMALNHEDGYTVFRLLSYSEKMEKWVIYTLDNRHGTTHAYQWARNLNNTTEFFHAPEYAIDDEYHPVPHAKDSDPALAETRAIWSMTDNNELLISEYVRSDSEWQLANEYKLVRNSSATR